MTELTYTRQRKVTVEFHRQRRGFAWRSCKVRLGSIRLMFTVAEGWSGVSVSIGRRHLDVQKHEARWIVHPRLTRQRKGWV